MSLCSGMAIFVLCYAFGHLSECHMNPVVTLCMCLLRRSSRKRAIFYVFSQLIGGLIGCAFLKLLTPQSWIESNCFSVNFIGKDVSIFQAFLTEFILTFFLLFVVMSSMDSGKSNQILVPVAVGMTVLCCNMVGSVITGTSLNPVRSFVTSVAASAIENCNAWEAHYIFWLGPILGGITASFLYEYCFYEAQPGEFKVDRLIDRYLLRKES